MSTNRMGRHRQREETDQPPDDDDEERSEEEKEEKVTSCPEIAERKGEERCGLDIWWKRLAMSSLGVIPDSKANEGLGGTGGNPRL